MVEEDYLSILFTLNFSAGANAIHLCWVLVRVHVNDFSIAAVSKQEACFRVSVNLKVRGVVVANLLSLP